MKYPFVPQFRQPYRINIQMRFIAGIFGCWMICIFPLYTIAQKYNNIWAFGTGAGLDFNTSGDPASISTAIAQWEGCASMADSGTGQLLFYTDGSQVWNANHTRMPNGNINVITYSTCQGAVIAPIPGIAGQYYVFSLGSSTEGNHADKGRLYYSVVDMRLNNGLGDIVAEKKRILLDTGLTEAMATIYYCKNNWLLVHSYNGNTFKAFPITSQGMGRPVVSEAGPAGTNITAGIIKVTSDGRRLTFHNQQGGGGPQRPNLLALFDFDPATGNVSNPLPLPNHLIYGITFSPDHSKLYMGSNGGGSQIFQYDISAGTAAAIIATEYIITTYPGRKELQLGPDNKIYIGTPGDNALSRIEDPNQSGAACRYRSDAIKLANGKTMQSGLPNTFYSSSANYQSSNRIFNCGATSYVMAADTTGWDYVWQDTVSGYKRKLNQPGIYHLTYKTLSASGGCDVNHIDTIILSPLEAHVEVQATCKGIANGKAWARPDGAATANYTYTWSAPDDSTILSTTDTLSHMPAGTYQVRITASGACSQTFEATIPEEHYQASFDTDTLICLGTDLQLHNTSDAHFNTWHWSFDDTTGASIPEPLHRYRESGHYQIRLIAAGPVCTDTAYQSITVEAAQQFIAFTQSKDSICLGETILFTPHAHASTRELEWLLQDEKSQQDPHSDLHYTFDKAGIFEVQLTGKARICPDVRFRDTVIVYPYPLVNLGADSVLCLQGGSLRLRNLAFNKEGHYRYQWSTGHDTLEQIMVTRPGIYALSLSNDLGCSTTEQVRVKKDCYTDIPNAFTPNGDGANDYFFPRQLLSDGLSLFRFQVRNRWGQIVFQSSDAGGRGWDGSFNHKEQPVGVYMYIMELQFKNEKTEKYNGNVTLMR